jgi:hypothetical protein
MQKKYIFTIVLASFALALVAHAQSDAGASLGATVQIGTYPPQHIEVRAMRDDVRGQRADYRGIIGDKHVEMHAEVSGMHEDGEGKTLEERASIRAEIGDKRDDFHDDMRAEHGSFMEKIRGKRDEIRGKMRDLVSARVFAASERMDGLVTRITSRMDKLTAQGKDVSSAKVHVDAAVVLLTNAKATFATIVRPTAGATLDEATKTANKAIYDSIKKSFEDARTHLQEAVKILVTLSPKVTGEANVKAQ